MIILTLAACAGQSASSTEASAPAATSPATTEAAPAATSSSQSAATSNVSFAKDIFPILNDRCVNCHGGEQVKAGLSLKTYDTLMKGSDKGPVVTAGDATNSKLVQVLLQGKMPKRGQKLTPDQVQLITDWINAGAQNN